MLTTSQKLAVAGFGGVVLTQGVAFANLIRVSFDTANKADALMGVVTKHAEHLDADDFQVLKNLNLMK